MTGRPNVVADSTPNSPVCVIKAPLTSFHVCGVAGSRWRRRLVEIEATAEVDGCPPDLPLILGVDAELRVELLVEREGRRICEPVTSYDPIASGAVVPPTHERQRDVPDDQRHSSQHSAKATEQRMCARISHAHLTIRHLRRRASFTCAEVAARSIAHATRVHKEVDWAEQTRRAARM
jgi:hypothetical protein